MNVAYLTNDFTPNKLSGYVPGGCAYYRCYLPMHAAHFPGNMGRPAWDVTKGFGLDNGNGTASFGYDVAVLKLLMYSWTPNQIIGAQKIGQKIIVDVDDYYHGLHESNMAHKATDPATSRVRNREHYAEVIRLADLVTVSTPFLEAVYKHLNPNIKVVRNGVLLSQFQRQTVRKGKPLIGWVGAVQWRSNDLDEVKPWLGDFLKDNDFNFIHSGTTPTQEKSFAELADVDPKRVIYLEMEPINYYYRLFRFDIGIVPLSDIPFNHAKSTIKGLEYVANGIPFVASNVGEYTLLNEQGVGRVASSPSEWVEHLSELSNYRTRRKDEATNYNLVKNYHNIDARKKEWRDAIASVQTLSRTT